ncbi:thioredoxin family protein [Mammaliicoccus stepanovicii]|uniref:Putative thioredoxin n=1 Tax=Mammaliicoccus stepanovicii TaxID=643214 RepID=A0A239YZD7_9STAP|nr:thioredoxin family protein [Mammaliicoccus stepanovicii]PNZ72486.1 thiol reductase thioredoxin [Mammaliicoccus stepanovicii]GGI40443.1 thiol reductase thioredoxin [Mammaliicoccus stepanovicii]SNV64107.1 putative thioredoxin [Mammaliicoccus stepanovicii]
MKQLTSIEEFKALIKDPTIVMFTASWCPDCHFIDPDLPALEEKYNHYQFISVDRDEFIDLCQEVGVMGIPSFIAYDNEVELGRYVGKERKTIPEISAFIDGLNK